MDQAQPSWPQPSSFVESDRVGVVILSAFAVVWVAAAVGLSTVPLAVSIPVAVVIVGVAIAMNLAARARHFEATDDEISPVAERQRRIIFIASNGVQAVLFSVLISICIATDELAFIPLVGAIIVGAHFFPIGLSFKDRAFLVGGGLLVFTGAAGTAIATTSMSTPEFAAGIVCLINAVVLVSVAGFQVRLYSRPRSRADAVD